jgi:hypothetical protein
MTRFDDYVIVFSKNLIEIVNELKKYYLMKGVGQL